MFYHIFYELLFDPDGPTSIFRLFRYITLRAAYATITSLFISLALGPFIIRLLKREGMMQMVRKEYLPNHIHKEAIPTCGGLIILLSIIGSMLLWGRFTSRFTLIIFFVTLWLSGLGLLDDYLKFIQKRSKGLILRYKLAGQILVATAVALYLYIYPITETRATRLNLPFFSEPMIDLGPLYILFVILVIVGASNAVNLTDGLDGLAAGSVIFAGIVYAGFTYVTGHSKIAEYLKIPYVSGCGELTVFLGAMVGACLGFLWFNAYPAQIFMGDTGSLMLGGILGTVAVLTRHEVLLVIIGGVFVMEAISVILQVGYYKLRKKRIFRMSPLHHHFELVGWPEPKIVIRFWIIAIIFGLLSLSTLKLR